MSWFESWFDGIKASFIKCFIREDRYKMLLEGVGVTVKVAILAAVIGLIIGFIIAQCNLSKIKLLNWESLLLRSIRDRSIISLRYWTE